MIQRQWITSRNIFRDDVIPVSIGSVGSSDVLMGLNGVAAATIPYGAMDTCRSYELEISVSEYFLGPFYKRTLKCD